MSRYWLWEAVGIALAVAALAAPSLALADVLEVGNGSAAWVAGGPAASTPAATPFTAETGAPITYVGASAAPAQWQARVAELGG